MRKRMPVVLWPKSLKPPVHVRLRGANPYEESDPDHIGQHIWARASTMAADRSRTETGRFVRTYLYASVLFTTGAVMLLLVMIGASMLFVAGTAEIARRRAARFVSSRFQGKPAGQRRGFGIRHWLRLLALQSAARLR